MAGSATVNLTVGDTYNDAGAIASDEEDGDLTANIVVNSNVNTGTAGTYTVTYDVSDPAGEPAQRVTRTLVVSAPPVQQSSGGGMVSLWELLALFAVIIGLRQRRDLRVSSGRGIGLQVRRPTQ